MPEVRYQLHALRLLGVPVTIRLKITKNVRVPPKSKRKYCIDDPTVPGHPYVGHGSSVAEALGNWVLANSQRHGIRLDPNIEEKK